jgi:predicted DNA-binding protein
MTTQTRDLRGVKDFINYAFRMPRDLHARIKKIAQERDVSIALIYQTAVERYLDELEKAERSELDLV